MSAARQTATRLVRQCTLVASWFKGNQPQRPARTTKPSFSALRSALLALPPVVSIPNCRATLIARTGSPSYSKRTISAAFRYCSPSNPKSAAVKTMMFCEALLEELVDPRRSPEPRPMGGGLRRRFLWIIRVRLRRARRPGPVAGRTAFRARRQSVWVCGGSSFRLRSPCPPDFAQLGHHGHANGPIPALRTADRRAAGTS